MIFADTIAKEQNVFQQQKVVAKISFEIIVYAVSIQIFQRSLLQNLKLRL